MLPFLKNSAEYLSITVNEDDLKVAHLKAQQNALEIIHLAKRDIRGISEEELPKVIKSILNDFNVKKPQVIFIAPSNLASTKNIEIPSLNPEEIKSIINLQAGRHTPYSREEIILDYVTIGIFQRNYSKILLVIVNRSIILKQIKMIEDAGLKVRRIFFAPEVMAHFYAKAMKLKTSDSPLGIINVGQRYTDFIVAKGDAIVTCRNIPVGISQLRADGKSGKDNLTAELKKSIESYQSEDVERLPENYVLTGDHEKVKELQGPLKDALQASVKIVPYLDNLKISQLARKAIGETGDDSFLDVVAPVMAFAEAKIDLLPEEIKMQRSLEEQSKEAIKTGIFAVIIFVLLCVSFFVKIYFKSSFLTRLESDYKRSREEAEILGRIAEKTGIIKDHFHNRLVSLEMINALYSIIPEEIYLNSVVLDEAGTITIQGTSESMSRVFSLVGSLEESQLFKSVKTNSTTAKKERGKDVAAFELTFKLESAKDEEETDKSKDKEEPKEEKGAEKVPENKK